MLSAEELLSQLSRPRAYPYPVERVIVHQTHISMVFVAGDFVYKVKKPVRLGFLDFSDLEKRRHFCEEEVRLNRRLAPKVYLGVAPVCADDGQLTFEGDGIPVEWAVKMTRLPDEATLESRLQREEISPSAVADLARRLAAFHNEEKGRAGAAKRNMAEYGRFSVVARNVRENFEQTAAHVGTTVVASVFERVRVLSEQQLGEHQALIESRAEGGLTCDTHGDLHLDHVYHFPERPPPDDWIIIDCIEFNDRFRYADPWADTGFLIMDLAFHGRRDLACQLALAYAQAADDAEGRRLAPLYAAYRAVVRAKVDGLKAAEEEIPGGERQATLVSAKAHWLLALGLLETPLERPCLLMVGGLPGTGKSTVSRGLAAAMNLTLIRSDEVRKELAAAHEKPHRYSTAWTQRTYAEMARRAEIEISTGGRVLIDANFRQAGQRLIFRELAARLAVPWLFLECTAPEEVVRIRLENRQGDASDADWHVYRQLASTWEPAEAAELRSWRRLDTAMERELALEAAKVLIAEAIEL